MGRAGCRGAGSQDLAPESTEPEPLSLTRSFLCCRPWGPHCRPHRGGLGDAAGPLGRGELGDGGDTGSGCRADPELGSWVHPAPHSLSTQHPLHVHFKPTCVPPSVHHCPLSIHSVSTLHPLWVHSTPTLCLPSAHSASTPSTQCPPRPLTTSLPQDHPSLCKAASPGRAPRG